MKALREAIAIAAILGMLTITAAAGGAADSRFHGRTSQHETISFRLSGDAVRQLDYHVIERCPGGRRLVTHDFNFPALRIRHGRFGGRFTSRDHRVVAVIRGRVARREVRGSLSDRVVNGRRHRACKGRATFRLRVR